jgi:hypothetical protein
MEINLAINETNVEENKDKILKFKSNGFLPI